MATFQEVMDAAGRAHQAGDSEGAQTLVDHARTLPDFPGAAPAQPKPERTWGDFALDSGKVALKTLGGIIDMSSMLEMTQEDPDETPGLPRSSLASYVPDPGPSSGFGEDLWRAGVRGAVGAAIPFGGEASAAEFLGSAGIQGMAGAGSEVLKKLGANPYVADAMALLAPAGIERSWGKGEEYVRSHMQGETDINEAVKAMQEGGVAHPTLGMVTGGKKQLASEAILRNSMGGQHVMQEADEAAASGIENRLFDIEGNLTTSDLYPKGGPADMKAGGEAVRRGVGVKRGEYEQNQAYLAGETSKGYPQNPEAKLDRSMDYLNRIANPGSEAGKLMKPYMVSEFVDLRDRLSQYTNKMVSPGMADMASGMSKRKGTVPLEEARRLKTEIGKKANSESVRGDPQLRSAYAGMESAIAEDLNNFHKAIDGDTYASWRREMENWESKSKLERSVFDALGVDSEKLSDVDVYLRATTNINRDHDKLETLLNNIPIHDRRNVSAAVLHGLGRVGADTPFSLSKFVTDYDKKLSAGSRKALFEGRHGKDVEQVVEAARKVKTALEYMKNASGTGRISAHINEVAGTITGSLVLLLSGHPGAALGLAGATASHAKINNFFARAVSDPKMMKWLADGTKIPAKDAGAMQRHLVRLARLAATEPDPDAKEGMTGLANALSGGQQ